MTSKEIFEVIIHDCENCKITKPLDSCVDFDTTIGEWYEEDIDEIKNDLEVLDFIKETYSDILYKHIKKIIDLYDRKKAIYETYKDDKRYERFKPSKQLEEDYKKSVLIMEWLERE